VYRESRHPTDIEWDTTSTKKWKEMTESAPASSDEGEPAVQPAKCSSHSSHSDEEESSSGETASEGEASEGNGDASEGGDDDTSEESSTGSLGEVEQSLSSMVKKGGVKYLIPLLANAVPLGSDISDTQNI
jgi:hypothetical protein